MIHFDVNALSIGNTSLLKDSVHLLDSDLLSSVLIQLNRL